MPTLHVIFGPAGAGKSTYARELARHEPAVPFLIDDWIGRLFGPDMPDQPDFNWMMERVERCEAQIWSTLAGVMAAGGSVVLDLGLMRRADRARVAEIAEAVELPVQFHFVTAPAEARRARIAERSEIRSGGFALQVSPDMFEFAEGVFEAPDAEELKGCVVAETA